MMKLAHMRTATVKEAPELPLLQRKKLISVCVRRRGERMVSACVGTIREAWRSWCGGALLMTLSVILELI